MQAEKCSTFPHHKWFGIALQALVVLAHKDQPCTSAEIAKRLQVEPTLLRRVMAELAREGLLETKEGKDGGYKLSRSAGAITLADVYLALQLGEPLCKGLEQTTGEHEFGQEMRQAFGEISEGVKNSALAMLGQGTIEQLTRRVCDLKKGIDNQL